MSMTNNHTERLDSLPDGKLLIWQDSREFCFTTDAVFLAAFPHIVTKARAMDLGCGTGAVAMTIAKRGAESVLAVDINAHVIDLLKRSLAENGMQQTVTPLCADLRDYRSFVRSESMDLVLANPPYRIGGRRRQQATAACHETTATMEDFFRVAAYALRTKGRFALVQLPDRFTDAVRLGIRYQLELKRLQWVHSYADRPAWIFLAEFVKGGKPGLEVLPPLLMYEKDGSYSRETLAYYYGSHD